MPGLTILAAAEAAPTFDFAIVTSLISVCKYIMGLVGEYPLNIL